ncbi:alpha/beta fold hydrolase [Actinomycetospora cinnamomea]|uniref:Pimeloyl-ACP methyl ester carboxylesterase n=1 Tax=Actinomycetospora cinnamomea TaxID=663609 RepID=A0A2U1FAA8_9PSEU|nr:alpha/beta fold hydrolase [Actinomycetospora cinnamomea]PVZ09127.1 pimeloyl-ACP methyl ester carboxylesterase [Actinomycetospora cinnamomea]
MREGVVRSGDGTALRMWDNAALGAPVVISNGIGASYGSWPHLAAPDCGVHAVGWHHRGLGGSQRPRDQRRIGVADHADDLEAVMDQAGFDRAVLVGWSLGVGIAFEVARRVPGRVAGILAVGGGPGAAFQLLRVPPGTPAQARDVLGQTSAWMLRVVGPPLAATASMWSAAASAAPGGRASHLAPLLDTINTFTRHDWTWFSRLVVEAGRQPALDMAAAPFPVTVVAGHIDGFVDTDASARSPPPCPTPASWPCRAATSSPCSSPTRSTPSFWTSSPGPSSRPDPRR